MLDDQHFAGRLKELREAKGLGQQELADLAGMKLGGVQNLEQGRTMPSWKSVVALCNALGVACDAFTTPPADRPAPGRGRPRKAEPAADAAGVNQDATNAAEAKDGPAGKAKGKKGKPRK